jgi:hypothetical protein
MFLKTENKICSILTVEEFAKIRTKPYRRTPDKEVYKMVTEIKSKLENISHDKMFLKTENKICSEL